MGAIDDFLRAYVAPGLAQGEQVLGFMHARNPIRFSGLGVPAIYDEWLAVATSSRLVFFRTENDFLGNPKALVPGHLTLVWSYDEIARVELGSVEGLTTAVFFTLVPHPMCGPEPGQAYRYDLFGSSGGLDDHARMRAAFPMWLQQQVAAGAFPMSMEKSTALQARIAAEHARIAAERSRATESARQFEARMKRAMPTLIGVSVATAMIGLALFSSARVLHDIRSDNPSGAMVSGFALVFALVVLAGLVAWALMRRRAR